MVGIFKFVNGTIADANEVNTNFATVYSNQIKQALTSFSPSGSFNNLIDYPLTDSTGSIDQDRNGAFLHLGSRVFLHHNYDNFEDSSIDSAKWAVFGPFSGSIHEETGSLYTYLVTSGPTGTGSCGWIGSGTTGFNFFIPGNTEICLNTYMYAYSSGNGAQGPFGSATLQISNGTTHKTIFQRAANYTYSSGSSSSFDGLLIIHLDVAGSNAYVSSDSGVSWNTVSLSTITGSWYLRALSTIIASPDSSYAVVDHRWKDIGFINSSTNGSIGSFTFVTSNLGSVYKTAIASTLGSANGSTFPIYFSLNNGTNYTQTTFDTLTTIPYGSDLKLKISAVLQTGSVQLDNKPNAPYIKRTGIIYG